jgi:hypothetical protein
VLAGLDNAGKTAVYNHTFLNKGADELENISPTRGIVRYTHEVGDDTLIIWELGGQQQYRLQHLANRDVFLGIHILIFVIDVQDNERYKEAINYFVQILHMLKDEYTKPKVFTLFHKFDLDKTKEMRKSLFEIYALLKGENKYGMKLVNFSTSIKADTTKQAYNKIFEDILPDQAKLKTEPKKEHLGTKILASKSKDAPEYDITMDIEKLTTLIMDDPDISRGFADQVITEVTLNGMETKTGHGSDNIDEYYNLKDKLKTISEIKNRGIGATIEIIDPLVQEFSNFLIGKAKNGTNLDIISKDEYTLIVNFVNTFVDMKSEFWHFIKEKQLKEYEIERRISKIFNELTTTLLDAVVINNIFDITHRAKINGVLSKLFS